MRGGLADFHGLGGLLTRADVDELRRANFGWRCLGRALHPDAIAAELARYDAPDARAVHEHVRATMDVATTVADLVDLYDEAAKLHAERLPDPAGDLRWLGDWVTRMARLALEHEHGAADQARTAAAVHADLLTRNAQLEQRLAHLAACHADRPRRGPLAAAARHAAAEARLADATARHVGPRGGCRSCAPATPGSRSASPSCGPHDPEARRADLDTERAELDERLRAAERIGAEHAALLATRTFRARWGVLGLPLLGRALRAAGARSTGRRRSP